MAAPRRRPPARAQRRKLVWARVPLEGMTVPAAGTEARSDLLPTSIPVGSTIARIRGRMTWTPTVYTTLQGCRVGLKVDANDAVITDEGPVTAEDDDWLMLEPFFYVPPGTGTGVVTDLQWQSQQLTREIDVKAMRRLSELDSTLWLYSEAYVGAATSDLAFDLSVLVMLP